MVICVGRQQLSLCDRQKKLLKDLLFHFISDDSFSTEKNTDERVSFLTGLRIVFADVSISSSDLSFSHLASQMFNAQEKT